MDSERGFFKIYIKILKGSLKNLVSNPDRIFKDYRYTLLSGFSVSSGKNSESLQVAYWICQESSPETSKILLREQKKRMCSLLHCKQRNIEEDVYQRIFFSFSFTNVILL